jgi:hypothetical protein
MQQLKMYVKEIEKRRKKERERKRKGGDGSVCISREGLVAAMKSGS